MAQPTRARADLRLDCLKKIDPVSEPKSSSCTSDSDATTVIKDTVLAPAAQSEDFVGDWIYIRSQPTKVDVGKNVDNSGVIAAGATSFDVEASHGIIVGDGIQIVDEIMLVTDVSTNTLTVTRAIQGTNAIEHADGTDVYFIGPAVGEISRVTDVDFAGTTSNLTPLAPAFSCSPVSSQEYERHRKIRPNILNDRLDVILGLLRQNVLLPVTILADGNMETDGVSAWTAVASTLTKDTTLVRHGRQSLKITATSATGQAVDAGNTLPSGTGVILEADVYITAGDSAKLTFYDATNATTIGTAMESDESGWVHLENTFTVPATCEIVQVKAESQASGDVTYWDHITLWPVYDKGLDLPTFLEFLYDVESLFFYPVGTGIEGTTNVNAYRINEGFPEFYAHNQKELDDTGVGASRFYVKGRRPTNALWIKGRKPYPVFSGTTDALKDVDTTQAHRNVVTNMTAASLIDDMALDATEAEKPQLAESLQNRALLLRFEIGDILANLTPPKKKIITTPFTRE